MTDPGYRSLQILSTISMILGQRVNLNTLATPADDSLLPTLCQMSFEYVLFPGHVEKGAGED